MYPGTAAAWRTVGDLARTTGADVTPLVEEIRSAAVGTQRLEIVAGFPGRDDWAGEIIDEARQPDGTLLHTAGAALSILHDPAVALQLTDDLLSQNARADACRSSSGTPRT